MSHLFRSALVALASLATVAPAALAHDDDGKVRDRQKPVFGQIWREGMGSVAGDFTSSGVQLKSWFPLNTLSTSSTGGNSCWGYISPAGREYAIMGTTAGTAFVEITDPVNATLKAFMTGPTSQWRDMRVYGGYCYAASEGGGGIQVFNISRLDDLGVVTLVGEVTAPSTTTAATHTLAIDTASGYLYRAGGGSNGLRFYDIHTNPAAPAYVGAWSPIYVHEAQVVTYTSGPYAGKQIAFCFGGLNGGNASTGLYIVDVTNKLNPQQLSYTPYPGGRYCHQGWIDEESRYIYINDELDEGATVSLCTTIVIDIANLGNPVYVNSFNNGNTAIGHNCFVKGTKLYEANYRSGLRIFDLAVNRTSPPEIAYFDTYPGSDSANFNGLWNVWPFFPSGTVIGSDIERGLFVWRVGGPVATFGVATAPALVNPAGGTTVDVTITPGAGQTLNQSSAIMKVTVAGTTTNVPLSPLGGNNYRATFPATACTSNVSYQFQVSNTAGESITDSIRSAVSAISVSTALDETFESASTWTGGVAGDTATSGQWVRVDPVATTAQPEDDHTVAPGVLCWITGNGTVGGAAGAADVDGGTTTLLSPVFNMSTMDEPTVEAWIWYSNNLGGAPNEDSMPIEISNNGGTSWTLIENYSANAGSWVKKSWRVRNYVTPTANVRMRFVARDLGTGSLVEAGLDDFKIIDVDCTASIPGDLNGDGVVNGADLAILLGAWGGTGLGDINGDGTVNGSDLALLLGAWG